jgi:co-chaperonin GroES (HSP10)
MNVIHKNVLVELSDETSKSGVYVPEEDKENTLEGTVIQCGEAVPEKARVLLENKPTIKYKKFFDGEEMSIKGKKYIVMNYESILLIL